MKEQATELLATAARWYVRHGPGRVEKPALSRALNAYLAEHPRHATVTTRTGARFEVTTEDLIQRYLYMFGSWEPHLTSWLMGRLKPGDVFVDIGANIGYFSVLASDLVGETGRVIAFEASPDFHRRLVRHGRLNGCTNLRAVNEAVSSRPETLRFTLASSQNWGANSAVPLDGPAESSFEAVARPLADLLEPGDISSARVIKIDVEGSEGAVLRGIIPLLHQLRHDVEIAVEISPTRAAQLGEDVTELLARFRESGFHAYRIPNSYRPESYPISICTPKHPSRWRKQLPEISDIILSRADSDALS